MPPNEKEINNYLFDQLTILERIERKAEKGSLDDVKEELKILKREVERKLYQKPPLTGN